MENKLDIVYPYRSSRWGKEIRYSLRSLENIEHDNVFIVGHLPRYVKNIVYIKADDIYPKHTWNAIHKILLACQDERLSDDFILMNDDFYFLKPQEIRQEYKSTLKQHIKEREDDKYGETLIETERVMNDMFVRLLLKSYELHYPIILNKHKFQELFNSFDWKRNIVWRSIYGNRYLKYKNKRNKDYKVRTLDELNELSDGDFISSGEPMKEYIIDLLKEKFPNRSVYELEEENYRPKTLYRNGVKL